MALATRSQEERAEQLYRAGIQKGLTDRAAWAYATIALEGERWGVPAAPILSGKRSALKQKAMQLKWDAGFRSGLAARPADGSAHTRGNAFDLSASARTLAGYGAIAKQLRGVRWGGNFQTPDRPHFDVEG